MQQTNPIPNSDARPAYINYKERKIVINHLHSPCSEKSFGMNLGEINSELHKINKCLEELRNDKASLKLEKAIASQEESEGSEKLEFISKALATVKTHIESDERRHEDLLEIYNNYLPPASSPRSPRSPRPGI
jgi:hypothetical protein